MRYIVRRSEDTWDIQWGDLRTVEIYSEQLIKVRSSEDTWDLHWGDLRTQEIYSKEIRGHMRATFRSSSDTWRWEQWYIWCSSCSKLKTSGDTFDLQCGGLRTINLQWGDQRSQDKRYIQWGDLRTVEIYSEVIGGHIWSTVWRSEDTWDLQCSDLRTVSWSEVTRDLQWDDLKIQEI